jgi:fumarylacetoacetate (FAA) hydrolase family protein
VARAGIVAATLGADVTATDLEGNLGLLRSNIAGNGAGRLRLSSVSSLQPLFQTSVALVVSVHTA